MPSGFSSWILHLEDDWSQVFATSPILTPLALLIFRGFSAGIFLGHAIAHIRNLALPCWCPFILLLSVSLQFVHLLSAEVPNGQDCVFSLRNGQ